ALRAVDCASAEETFRLWDRHHFHRCASALAGYLERALYLGLVHAASWFASDRCANSVRLSIGQFEAQSQCADCAILFLVCESLSDATRVCGFEFHYLPPFSLAENSLASDSRPDSKTFSHV